MEALSTEVRRVVNCPYGPVLKVCIAVQMESWGKRLTERNKPLYDILQSDHCPVDAWGQANNCRIRPLAETVLEELGSQPSYALEILTLLCLLLPSSIARPG